MLVYIALKTNQYILLHTLFLLILVLDKHLLELLYYELLSLQYMFMWSCWGGEAEDLRQLFVVLMWTDSGALPN